MRTLGALGNVMLVAALASLTLSASLGAQLPQVGVPKGRLRIEIGSNFDAANAELFHGTRTLQNAWNGDLGPALDAHLLASEAAIRTLTGNGTYQLSAGRSSIHAATTVGTGSIGATLGLTRRISIFGTVPFVRSRWQTKLSFDSTGANTGFNPADPTFGTAGGQSAAAAFLSELSSASAALAAKIANGDYDANPAQKAFAIQTLGQNQTLLTGMTLLLGSGAPFSPLDSSAEATAIRTYVDSMQARDSTLGVTPWHADPVFAAKRIDQDGFAQYLLSPTGQVQSVFRGDAFLQRFGDVELGANVTILDRPHLRIAATGLVRLPTGLLDKSDNLFDVGTGDGQTDLEGRLITDLGAGSFGLRISVGHNRQMARDLERRVSSVTAPISWASDVAVVSLDPGDETTIGLEPFVRLAPGFALTTGWIQAHRGADQMTLAGGGPVATTDIAAARRVTALQAGLSFASEKGILGNGTPMDARWFYREVVSASGARVDRTRTVAMQVRVYYSLW